MERQAILERQPERGLSFNGVEVVGVGFRVEGLQKLRAFFGISTLFKFLYGHYDLWKLSCKKIVDFLKAIPKEGPSRFTIQFFCLTCVNLIGL